MLFPGRGRVLDRREARDMELPPSNDCSSDILPRGSIDDDIAPFPLDDLQSHSSTRKNKIPPNPDVQVKLLEFKGLPPFHAVELLTADAAYPPPPPHWALC